MDGVSTSVNGKLKYLVFLSTLILILIFPPHTYYFITSIQNLHYTSHFYPTTQGNRINNFETKQPILYNCTPNKQYTVV